MSRQETEPSEQIDRKSNEGDLGVERKTHEVRGKADRTNTVLTGTART